MSDIIQINTVLASRYRLLRYLGSGSFANTYLAIDTHFENNSRIVVVKELKPALAHLSERFRSEAEFMHGISHPNIVKVTDLFNDHGTVCFVVDFLNYGTLSSQKGKLTERQAVEYIKQVLKALSAVHRAGICHLDVKPSNILLDTDGKAVLTDFGASILLNSDDKSARTELFFSPGFAPEEQLRRDIRHIGPWTDIYAVGATLYCLLTGTPPPIMGGLHSLFGRSLKIKGADKGVMTFINACLSPFFKNRPQTAEEALALLERATPSDRILLPKLENGMAEVPSGFLNTLNVGTVGRSVPKNKVYIVSLVLLLFLIGIVVWVLSWKGLGNDGDTFESPTINLGDPTEVTMLTLMLSDKCPLSMVYVQGGAYMMGATAEQKDSCENDELPARKVIVSDYYIGRTEVTQAQWLTFMETNPSAFAGAELPVNNITRFQALAFIDSLNKHLDTILPETLQQYRFRMPTEAEWEFAARGGRNAQGRLFSGSDNVDEVSWYRNNSALDGVQQPHNVATKNPNELSLYDMSGNVWEFCFDRYQNYYGNLESYNPKGPEIGNAYVARGGSFPDGAPGQRVSDRNYFHPEIAVPRLGLRLVLARE